MSLNKVITSVNALANSVSIPADKLNNVVCIDIENNRIGVKTGNPEKEIDISGMLKTNFIYINNENNHIDEFDISYDNPYLTFSRGLKVSDDISCENIVSNSIKVPTISSDISFLNNVDITGKLNVIEDISCEYIRCNRLDVSGITTDISFLQNVDIEKQLNVKGILFSTNDATTSDDRLKHNEKIIINGLEIIRQLQPQVYQKTSTFKPIDYTGEVSEPYRIEAGFIAQEVNAIHDISFTVIEGNEVDPYYLMYDNLFVYGVAGLKELDNIVNNLSIQVSNIINGTPDPDISQVNLSNVLDFVKNQNILIQTLNSKISSLETRIINLE